MVNLDSRSVFVFFFNLQSKYVDEDRRGNVVPYKECGNSSYLDVIPMIKWKLLLRSVQKFVFLTYVMSAKGSSQQASLRSERSAQKSSSLKIPRICPIWRVHCVMDSISNQYGTYQMGNIHCAFPLYPLGCQSSSWSDVGKKFQRKNFPTTFHSPEKLHQSKRQRWARIFVCQTGSRSHRSAKVCC